MCLVFVSFHWNCSATKSETSRPTASTTAGDSTGSQREEWAFGKCDKRRHATFNIHGEMLTNIEKVRVNSYDHLCWNKYMTHTSLIVEIITQREDIIYILIIRWLIARRNELNFSEELWCNWKKMPEITQI